eukprot:GHVL01004040.1.p1 GENE.GHVL01004040.1~~GHVL01004040.1.p1  ORF type:complete len:639 (+),score=90.74 GHVL01004040.1:202-2118(+)
MLFGLSPKRVIMTARSSLLTNFRFYHQRYEGRSEHENIENIVNCALKDLDNTPSSDWFFVLPKAWKKSLAFTLYFSDGPAMIINRIRSIQQEKKSLMDAHLYGLLINECCKICDVITAQRAVNALQSLKLDPNEFKSSSAETYFLRTCQMLAHEQIGSFIKCMTENLTSDKSKIMVQPVIIEKYVTLTGTVSENEAAANPKFMDLLRGGAVVLLRPPRTSKSENEIFQRALLDETATAAQIQNQFGNALLGSVKSAFWVSEQLTVSIEPLSLESVKAHRILNTGESLELYHAIGGSIVTAERMQKALEKLCLKRGKKRSSKNESFSEGVSSFILETDSPITRKIVTGEEGDNALTRVDENVERCHQKIISNDLSCNKDKAVFDCLAVNSLTKAQSKALISSIYYDITLIQGPPGTGKTHTACAILSVWAKSGDRILGVADSNVGADNLMIGLKKLNVNAIRVGSKSNPTETDLWLSEHSRFHEYKSALTDNPDEAMAILNEITLEAVKKVPIVISTCIGVGLFHLRTLEFKKVLIDECSQSIEPSSLVALSHGCESLVLIGDTRQLPPVVMSNEAQELGLSVSLFERVVNSGVTLVHLLDVQRRMHSSIAVDWIIIIFQSILITNYLTQYPFTLGIFK